ncbi:MAG: outer membrane lipoprotein chaperone LolA [Enterovibrio sp.]
MKQWLLGFAAMISVGMSVSVAQAAPAAQEQLSARLDKIRSFSAAFEQVVTDPDKKELSRGKGTVSVSRPNLFRWQVAKPDENTLVSDGKTLWHYDPLLEQVSAMWLKDATEQTPFVLLTRNDPKDWINYRVSMQGNAFTLKPIRSSNTREFVVNVLPTGQITHFYVVEQDGQTSHFTFNSWQARALDPRQFRFAIPKGAELDDQRQ